MVPMNQNSKNSMKLYDECENSGIVRDLFDGVSVVMSDIGCSNMMFTSHCKEHSIEHTKCAGCISENACIKAMLLFNFCILKRQLLEAFPDNHDIHKALNSMRGLLMRPA